MQPHIKLGRIWGIQIGLHLSWILIAFLIAFSLAAQFALVNPDWSTATVWTTAIVTGLLFFVSVILHELSHAAVAKMRGLPVRSITLFALGGVASIEKDAADASTEFWMGIAGPIASVVIGVLCLAAASAFGWVPENQLFAPSTPALTALVWLGFINITLAIFNMLPGFPLDGGRVLRAIIWWVTGNVDRSTRIAARVGQIFAILFIVWGVFQFFSGAGFGGLWLAFIGWFLLSAAGASYAQVEVTQNLRGLKAADVMRNDCAIADGWQNLQQFVDENILRSGNRCFLVVEDNHLAGLITTHEIKDIPRDEWPSKTVADAMRTFDNLQTIKPETSLTDALETMASNDVNQLPVVSGRRIAGVISRNSIVQLLQTRRELEV